MPERPYWLAAGVVAWGAILFAKAMELPQFDQHAGIGPGMVPSGIGAGLVLLGLMLGWQIAQGVRFEEQGAEDIADDHAVSVKALGLAAAACALPLLTMPTLGFVATGTGCFVLVAAAFRSRRLLLDLALGAGFSFLCWYLFGRLGVQLGPLLPLLEP
jgi:putative tricarboxylic transport membrane protein